MAATARTYTLQAATGGLTLCRTCRRTRFLIGVPIWPDKPDSPRVCDRRCAARERKHAKQEATEEAATIAEIGAALATGELPI